ncbi:hypothetical protein DE146DRAFT_647204 [Phaeosphaeria sp. MPI-PUGE-AT-0046c]|nr:hypothetical protein DE146DRAFT_647204 [Phaeosphaeria sp. MPI-PUGE-AT-0046c]
MLFIQLFYSLLALLVSIAAAIPLAEDSRSANVTIPDTLNISDPILAGEQGWDPSFYHHDYSMVQVWMGKAKTQVGTLIEAKLYEKIRELLDKHCPVNSFRRVCHKDPIAVAPALCVNPVGKHAACELVITKISAEWTTDSIREYMITAVAGALQAATLQGFSDRGNCWDLGGGRKACNVGDVVRVNFPELPEGRANYMHIWLTNWHTGYGYYDCCSEGIRARMDSALDSLRDRMKLEFPKQAGNSWYRDSRCIINGWATCPDGASNN